MLLDKWDAEYEVCLPHQYPVIAITPRNLPLSGGYTVILKSKGPAAKNQADCLGVYRVVDSLNDKPVYKQDSGDHYLYYHQDHDCWLVGSRVGQEIGWIKNQPLAKGDSKLQLQLTDLPTGWQYQSVASADRVDGKWLADDDSLTVEVLKGEWDIKYCSYRAALIRA